MNQYFNNKLSLFLTEVSFGTSEENQLSYFQNGNLKKILWGCHEPYNQVKCREKKLSSELFTNRFFENTFVSFEVRQRITDLKTTTNRLTHLIQNVKKVL